MSRSGTYDPKLGFIPNDDCETPRQTNAEKLMEFLEETLPQIVTPTTDALYAVSIDENRVPKTVFYNCDSVDRWAIIGAIFADAMLAFVEDNAEEINKVLNGEVEEDGSKS